MKFIRNNQFFTIIFYIIIDILKNFISTIYKKKCLNSKAQSAWQIICLLAREDSPIFGISSHMGELLSYPPIGREKYRRIDENLGTTVLRISFVSLFFFSTLSTKFMFLFRKLQIPEKTYMTADLGHLSLLKFLYRT